MDKQTKIAMLRAVVNGQLQPSDLIPKRQVMVLQAGPDNAPTIAAIRQQEVVANERIRAVCGGTGPEHHTAFIVEQE